MVALGPEGGGGPAPEHTLTATLVRREHRRQKRPGQGVGGKEEGAGSPKPRGEGVLRSKQLSRPAREVSFPMSRRRTRAPGKLVS